MLLAGGSGTRMGTELNKVYLPVGGVPVIHRSLATLVTHPAVAVVVLVIRPDDAERARAAVAAVPGADEVVQAVVAGGASRHGSETNGLAALRALPRPLPPVTLVHDGARPFLTVTLLDRLLAAAAAHGGAVPGFPPDAPVFRVDAHGLEPVDGSVLRRVQTPQAFGTDALLAAYDAAGRAGFEGVDTADAVQRFTDTTVVVVPGDPRNVKLTTVEDLQTAAWLAERFVDGGWVA